MIKSFNPATRELLGTVEASLPEEIAAVVAACHTAQLAWRKEPVAARLAIIESFRVKLLQSMDRVAELISHEVGKPVAEAIVSEIFSVLETAKWLVKNAAKVLAPEKVSLNPLFFWDKKSYNIFEPLGVVAIISPWNYPFAIPAASMLAALAAGNGVVLKPSPKTPLTASVLVELFKRAGFPDGLVGLVQGDREQVENLLQQDINKVAFTGSVPGGQAIMSLAAQRLIPVALELGGKHPAIALADADVDLIAPALVWGAFTNAGQACASIDRLYVEESLAPRLTERLVKLTGELRIGQGLEKNTDVGPLVDEMQLLRVQSLLEDARAQGADVLCGGRRHPELGGFFLEPTVIAGVKPEMRLAREEIFGPLLTIIPVKSAADAIAMANNSELGLAASIWTQNMELGKSLAAEVNAGVVWLNDALYSHICPDAPWGGMKKSGFGRIHSKYELLEYVNIKNIGIAQQRKRDWGFPYDDAGYAYVHSAVQLVHGQSLGERLKALITLGKIMAKR